MPSWFTFSTQRRTWSFHVVCLQRTAKKCTKNYNDRAQSLFSSFNLWFSDVAVAVVVFLSSLISFLWHIELSNSFLIGRKRTVNFRNQRPWHHNCRFYNHHVKETQGHRLYTLTSTLIILEITKTSCNNCLLNHWCHIFNIPKLIQNVNFPWLKIKFWLFLTYANPVLGA